MRLRYASPLLAIAAAVSVSRDSCAQPSASPRTILAIGAHAGDMELTAGAVLIKQRKLGDRVVILQMTLGEGGNPRMSPSAYGAQKHREALAADSVIGAETIFAPYRDGEIPNDEAVRRYVADVIRTVKPTYIITHWSHSIHKDHSNTSTIVQDAVLLASLEGVVTQHPPHRGVRGVYYADNWEDAESFSPYIYVGVSDDISRRSGISIITTLFLRCVERYRARGERWRSTSTSLANGECLIRSHRLS